LEGIRVYNVSATIENMKIEDTKGKSVVVGGASSDVTIDKVTMTNSEKDKTARGLRIDYMGDVELKNSNIDNTFSHSNILTYSYVSLDIKNNDNNIICREGTYTISNSSSTYFIEANQTWWGSMMPPGDEFFQTPDSVEVGQPAFEAHVNGAPAKIATPDISETDIVINMFRNASEREKYDYVGAMEIYIYILSMTDSPQWRRKAIKRMIRVCIHNNLDFTDVKDIISSELVNARSAYKASLDFLLCDISVKEALREENIEVRQDNIMDSINGFSGIAQKYSGTSMEVETLSYIATLYGDHLHDTIKAKECADAAASINPGQGCLFDAYASAGAEYIPDLYTDRFKDIFEDFGDPPEKPALGVVNYVSVYPNPLNPKTTISYSIKNPSHVKLVIYNITGQKVASLVDKHMGAGKHSVIFDGSDFGSGVYLYKFESKGFSKTGKMLLLK